MSATFSSDNKGRTIDADATELQFPRSATDADLALVAQTCKQLQTLDLSCCDKITDAGLAHIAGLKQLQVLYLQFCAKITDVGLAHIAGIEQLQSLGLGDCKQITDAGLAHIATLQQLQSLNISLCNKITDAGLAYIAGLKQLQVLYLGDCVKITDAGLAHIAGLKQLQMLNLERCKQISDAGLAHIAGLQQLQKLIVGGCPHVTDAGLIYLLNLKQLQPRELDTGHTAVTDAGLDAFGAAQAQLADLRAKAAQLEAELARLQSELETAKKNQVADAAAAAFAPPIESARSGADGYDYIAALKAFNDEQKAVLRAEEITQQRFAALTEFLIKEMFPSASIGKRTDMAAEVAATKAAL